MAACRLPQLNFLEIHNKLSETQVERYYAQGERWRERGRERGREREGRREREGDREGEREGGKWRRREGGLPSHKVSHADHFTMTCVE